MSNAVTTPTKSQPGRLVDQVNELKLSMSRQRILVTDMSRAGTLESGIGTDAHGEVGTEAIDAPIVLDRLEGKIAGRKLEAAQAGASRFRYFLDGCQKTIPICRIGITPVVVALSAVGILQRGPGGQGSLLSGTLHVNQTWIAPRETGHPDLDRLIQEIADRGGSVIDPFVDRGGLRVDNYIALSGNYAKMLSYAFDMAGRIRGQQEEDILETWQATDAMDHPDDWIVVDGRLRSGVKNGVGLVKELQTQHLVGDEALALFDLPQGYRTSAFRYISSSRQSDPRGGTDTSENRTMWYMRFWNATGMDARHSLVRIEAPHHIESTEQIDELSGWILSERLPRATDDPRWPTMLYPIYYLERILKRRLAQITAGWPSA